MLGAILSALVIPLQQLSLEGGFPNITWVSSSGILVGLSTTRRILPTEGFEGGRLNEVS